MRLVGGRHLVRGLPLDARQGGLGLALDQVAYGGDLDVLVGLQDVPQGPGPAAAAPDDADVDGLAALGEQAAGPAGPGPGVRKSRRYMRTWKRLPSYV